jgi:predicted nucleic-acid-binding Zn-ribbon protein
MNDSNNKTGESDRLAKLVTDSFPNLVCLRCGSDQFYVTDDPAVAGIKEARRLLGLPDEAQASFGPIVTLACRRCGYIEQHFSDILHNAKKPIDWMSRK